MKVNVMQDVDVKFSKYSWWSKWIDVAVYDYGHQSYLIQMKISRRNAKRFKSVKTNGFTLSASANSMQVGDLTPMKGDSND